MASLEIRKWDTPVSKAAVAADWAADGFSCDLWVDPPGRQWLDFVHATDERVVVQEGRVEFEVSGARVLLEPGDEVFIPAGARHSAWNRGKTTARWFYGYRHA